MTSPAGSCPVALDFGYAEAAAGKTIYVVVGPAAGWVTPTAAQIAAGQLASGGAATWAGNAPWVGSGQWGDATGLTPGAAYRAAAVVGDGGSYSNVVEAGNFTTLDSSALWLSASGALSRAASGARRVYLMPDGTRTASATPPPGARPLTVGAGGELIAQ